MHWPSSRRRIFALSLCLRSSPWRRLVHLTETLARLLTVKSWHLEIHPFVFPEPTENPYALLLLTLFISFPTSSNSPLRPWRTCERVLWSRCPLVSASLLPASTTLHCYCWQTWGPHRPPTTSLPQPGQTLPVQQCSGLAQLCFSEEG